MIIHIASLLNSHDVEFETVSSPSIVMLAGILPGKVRDLASTFPNLKHLDLSTVTCGEQYRSPLELLLYWAEYVKLPLVTTLKTTIGLHGEFWHLQSSVLHCIDDLSESFPNLSALSLTDMSTDASSDQLYRSCELYCRQLILRIVQNCKTLNFLHMGLNPYNNGGDTMRWLERTYLQLLRQLKVAIFLPYSLSYNTIPILEICKPSSEYHDRVSGFDAYSLVDQKRGEFPEQADGILLKRSVEGEPRTNLPDNEDEDSEQSDDDMYDGQEDGPHSNCLGRIVKQNGGQVKVKPFTDDIWQELYGPKYFYPPSYIKHFKKI